MILVGHELKQGLKSLLIWALSIGFFLVICVIMFPQMESQMEEVNSMFSSMGTFSDAFGLDQLQIGTMIGFYAVECGNILSVGGAFFAAIVGIQSLAKEEKDKTAEFLLTHPVSRSKIVWNKFIAVMIQLLILNVIAFLSGILSIYFIGEEIPFKEIILLHMAYYFLQVELSFICFGISCFSKQNGIGLGIGMATVFYFMNIVANISDQVKFLKNLTPFGYAEASDIVSNANLDWKLISCHLAISFIFVLVGWFHYCRKNISN